MTTSRPSEEAALVKFGARWAVLAAWCADQRERLVASAPPIADLLASARVKIASGCYSPCEVNCDLSAVEASLVSAEASAAGDVDRWLELLAQAMADHQQVERVLGIPAIKAHFADCVKLRCSCGNG